MIHPCRASFQETRSQIAKRWFERELLVLLMRLQGMERNAPSGYAEDFYCRKWVS
jgi:hypothetical protein